MKCLSIIMLMLLPLAAVGQSVYKWVDKDGNVHYSQSLPPEQAAGGHERLTREGLVAERVERVRTEEERAQLEELERQQAEASELQRLRARQDRLFLASFPTEQDVARAAEAKRAMIETERDSLLGLIEQTRVRFNEDVEQAAAYERRGEPVPEFLQHQVKNSRERLRTLNRQLAEIRQRMAALDTEYAANLQRHRRLRDPG